MTVENRPRRDAFTFSLSGARFANGYTFVPAIDESRLGKAWDRRRTAADSERPRLVHQIEDFLARYFAPGCDDLG